MNAASISTPDIITETEADSDSDGSSDEIPDYYQPLSSDNNPPSNGYHEDHLWNADDYPAGEAVENGITAPAVEEEDEDEDDEEEEMRRRMEADAAIRRSFLQDESRRNAPLPSDNASRVIEAMRSVSLSLPAPPDWANNFADDRWLNHLQRLRHTPTSTPCAPSTGT